MLNIKKRQSDLSRNPKRVPNLPLRGPAKPAPLRADHDRRKPRWPTRLRARYQRFEVVDGQLVLGPIESTVARDVSAQGLFLQGAPLKIGERVHVFVMLESGPVEMFGEVMHSRAHQPALGSAVDGVGVRFTVVSPRAQRLLREFLDERDSIKHITFRAAEARVRASTILGG
jgi:hypothetical protein